MDLGVDNVTEAVFSARTLWIALWTGLAILTLSLVVLSWTRLGQVRPLSKCVVLSVFAHVLLIVYAYETDLFVQTPGGQASDEIRVSFELDEARPPTERDADAPEQPWQQFPSVAVIDITPPQRTARLEQQMPDPQREMPRQIPAIERRMPADHAVPDRANVPRRVRRPDSAARSHTEVDAAPIEAPRPARREEPADRPEPETAELARMDTPDLPDTHPPHQTPETIPKPAGDPGLLHRLAEIPLPADRARAVPDREDDAVRTDNLADDSWQRVAPTGPGAASTAPSNAVPADVNASPRTDRRKVDGRPLPAIYRFRVANDRLQAAAKRGATPRTEEAVEAAIEWLAANQNADGRWQPGRFGAGAENRVHGHDRGGAGGNADTGITGLALLALLGAGHTHLDGDYRTNVKNGLEFLVAKQHDNGSLAGDARVFAAMYCHAMASLALSEAYAMTGDEWLRRYVDRAAAYSVGSQHPTSGGWRYQPGDLGDTSQFGWQVMALSSAQIGGVAIPERTQHGMNAFLQSVTSGSRGGLAGYRPNERVTRAMTAEAFVCRVFLKWPLDAGTIDEMADFLMQETPGSQATNYYYWYYATLAMCSLQDRRWDRWNRALQDRLLETQRTDGTAAGSWNPTCTWGSYGGRIYSTAMATMCLEVYYRYLPVLKTGTEIRTTGTPLQAVRPRMTPYSARR